MKAPERSQPRPGLIRRRLVAAPYAVPVDLHGKKIIVTGAAPGSIGFETARTLASWGACVVVTTRSNLQAAVQKLRGFLRGVDECGTIDAHPLDLSKSDSVARFASWYRAKHGEQLDVLINNAGIHLDLLSQWKTPRSSDDGFETHWRTNYLGTMHLTHLLLPLLEKTGNASGDARIVNVVSQLHSKGTNAGLFAPIKPYNSWVAYGLSKLALVHATFEIQRRHAGPSRLQAYCLHPGAVFTNIADKGLAGNPVLEAVRRAMAPIERFFLLTPAEGAQTQVHCATHQGLAGGLYYRQCLPAKPSIDTQDVRVSARLWDETAAWVKTLS
jgi:NAD(P)-dependent dehydrogenase (short-subunit alcohol dehydrogenase family)